jgi:predicted O-methyltransferase YrrM
MKVSVVFHDHIQNSLHRIVTEHGRPKTVIEIGVFEGATTFQMAQALASPDYKHYAVDPFLPIENLREEVVNDAKAQFMENLADFPCVELIEKKSFDGLIELWQRGVKAELIYVDGSHFAKDVLADAVLGFELLKIGGVMLFDDAVSWRYGSAADESPKLAIDSFIQCNWSRMRVLEMPNGYQVAIKRMA